jgi:phosphatidate cytidylyltransferase
MIGAALSDPIFLAYAKLVGGLLAAAGVILAFVTFVLRKNVSGVWKTYLGWLIMIPLVFGALAAGREATIIGIGLLAGLGFKEFARATGLYDDWWMTGTVYLGILAVVVTSLVSQPRTGAVGWYGLFMAIPVYVVSAILIVPIVRDVAERQLQRVALAILGFVYLGWMFSHLGFLANTPNAVGYLLFLVVAVEGNDIAAFTCGKLFGKRKLRRHISPNKTLGGSVGAVGVSLILPWLLSFSFPHFGPVELVLTGLIVGVGGQLGDLAISFIKRDIGIKDMGALIPGHGGVLDRIDSLIFVAPLFFHMTRWFHGLD